MFGRQNHRALRIVRLILITANLAVLLSLMPNAEAFALTVSDNPTADTHWTLADSPVSVTVPDWTIPVGVTLTIDAGVAVQFADRVTAYGQIIALGTATAPVAFDALDTSVGWSGIFFVRGGCADPHSLSVIDHAVLSHLTQGLVVDRQSLSLENSDVSIVTAGNFAVHAYNNNTLLCPGPWAELHLLNNHINFTTSYSGSGSGEVKTVWIDGMNSRVENNTMAFTFNGGAIGAYGMFLNISNTAAFSANITGNALTANATNDFTDFLYGINFINAGITGTIAGNTLTLNAKNEIHAIVANNNAIIGNDVTAVSSSDWNISSEIDFIGIESYSIDATTSIVDNRVELSSPNKRYIVGLLCQSGTVLNNRFIATLSGTAGYAIGILQQYGSADIENNSILLTSSPSISLYGVFLPASSSSESLILSNNIFAAMGSLDSTGIFALSSYAGLISNSYNLLYNFTTTYIGVAPGVGDIYDDPMFTDLHTLALDPNSPAINGGNNMGASPVVPADPLPTEPLPTPIPDPAPAPTPVIPNSPVITTNKGQDFRTTKDFITINGTADPVSDTIWMNNDTLDVVYTPNTTTWSYSGPLAPGLNTFTVFAKDASGLVSPSDTIQITRRDVQAPTVVDAIPGKNDKGVLTTTNVSVTFSERMDPTTVTATTFYINGVAGDVTYSGTTAEFWPTAPLQKRTTYTVTLTQGLKDEAGNSFKGTSWSFTTVRN